MNAAMFAYLCCYVCISVGVVSELGADLLDGPIPIYKVYSLLCHVDDWNSLEINIVTKFQRKSLLTNVIP